MNNNTSRMSLLPFPPAYRASGVVLDVATLPSPYGIGDVGPGALTWVDRLYEAGQSWWHALKSGRPPYCDSVYQTYSSFAGNVLLISPDWLIEDGLLSSRDCECTSFPACSIDYDVVVPFKHWLLEKAWKRFNAGARKDLHPSYERFRTKNSHWLEDYALFCALKARYRGVHYREWPTGLVRRDPAAMGEARHELTNQIDQVRFSQFVFFRQAQRLKNYAHTKGVHLIGDLFFLVSADSSDAWAEPELFVSVDQSAPHSATELSPICFSSGDQLVPSQDRAATSRVSYRWCVDRLRGLQSHLDVACVDVRAFAASSHAAVDPPAIRGRKDRGLDLLTAVGGLIADGIALIPTDGFTLRDSLHVTPTRVLQCAFDGRSDNPHLPQNYPSNSVVYTGMQEGVGTQEWFNQLPEAQRHIVWTYLNGCSGEDPEVAWELISRVWFSSAALALVPLPDLLNLGEDRPSQSGRAKGHWRWRCREDLLAPAFYRLKELSKRSNRSPSSKEISKPAAAFRPTRTQASIEAAL